RGVSRMNSVMNRAGQEIRRRGDAFRPAKIRPRSRAMKKQTTVACSVTTRPFIRMGRMDRAKAQLLEVSQAIPSSMSGPPCAPAPDRALQQHHERRKNQGHAEIHE